MNFLLCFSSHFFDIKIIFATWASKTIRNWLCSGISWFVPLVLVIFIICTFKVICNYLILVTLAKNLLSSLIPLLLSYPTADLWANFVSSIFQKYLQTDHFTISTIKLPSSLTSIISLAFKTGSLLHLAPSLPIFNSSQKRLAKVC